MRWIVLYINHRFPSTAAPPRLIIVWGEEVILREEELPMHFYRPSACRSTAAPPSQLRASEK